MIYTDSVIVHDELRGGSPTVLLIVGDCPNQQLLDFFREKGVSLSAERKYAQVSGRFITWLSIRAHEFTDSSQRSLLYLSFVRDLRFGTYVAGSIAAELHWTHTSHQNAKRLIDALLELSDWLNKRYGTQPLNPIHFQASFSEQLIFWRRWNKVSAKSLLRHIKSRSKGTERASRGRKVKGERNRNALLLQTKSFPANRLDDLLWRGFINPGHKDDPRPWRKFNLRNMLITILCTYGACRASEPLHLWVDDVYVDPDAPDVALVLIHDPSDGKVEFTDPISGTRKTTFRADFLQRFCGGRRPLTVETGRRHSGWKGSLLSHPERKAMQVFWIDKNAGRLFLTLWRLYIQHVRPVTHQVPWAFLTEQGQPLGFKGFDDAFRAAVRRIGLIPRKERGTSSQGLRHRYGQWLNELEVDTKVGQVAMHHTNITSQEVYREKGVAEIASAISKLTAVALPKLKETE